MHCSLSGLVLRWCSLTRDTHLLSPSMLCPDINKLYKIQRRAAHFARFAFPPYRTSYVKRCTALLPAASAITKGVSELHLMPHSSRVVLLLEMQNLLLICSLAARLVLIAAVICNSMRICAIVPLSCATRIAARRCRYSPPYGPSVRIRQPYNASLLFSEV